MKSSSLSIKRKKESSSGKSKSGSKSSSKKEDFRIYLLKNLFKASFFALILTIFIVIIILIIEKYRSIDVVDKIINYKKGNVNFKTINNNVSNEGKRNIYVNHIVEKIKINREYLNNTLSFISDFYDTLSTTNRKVSLNYDYYYIENNNNNKNENNEDLIMSGSDSDTSSESTLEDEYKNITNTNSIIHYRYLINFIKDIVYQLEKSGMIPKFIYHKGKYTLLYTDYFKYIIISKGLSDVYNMDVYYKLKYLYKVYPECFDDKIFEKRYF